MKLKILRRYNENRMTVLIAINTRDAIVMGSDSQGTVTRPYISPEDLSEFFDRDNGQSLKVSADGQPVLDNWSKIACRTKNVPYKSYTYVDKMHSLKPLNMGIMSSGISAIGERSIKSLLGEFMTTAVFTELSLGDYTLKETSEHLLAFFRQRYLEEYPEGGPDLDLMLCGYDNSRYTAGVSRIHVHLGRMTEPDYDFCIFFGGITRELQRLLFGIDVEGKVKLMQRNRDLLTRYHELLTDQLRSAGVDAELKLPEEFGSELKLFHDWHLDSLQMNTANYSEQTALEAVEFLINVMIKTQRFSNQMPSTGGEPQIAIIRKHTGYEIVTP